MQLFEQIRVQDPDQFNFDSFYGQVKREWSETIACANLEKQIEKHLVPQEFFVLPCSFSIYLIIFFFINCGKAGT